MTLLRFRQTVVIIQNLRLALRIAEERALDEVSVRLRDALEEAERAKSQAREEVVVRNRAGGKTRAEA